MKIPSVKTGFERTPQERAKLYQELRDQHDLNVRQDDHLEVRTCAGCGEDFYANRNDGDYCCYEHSDGHWHGDPDKAGAESTQCPPKTGSVGKKADDFEDDPDLVEGTPNTLSLMSQFLRMSRKCARLPSRMDSSGKVFSTKTKMARPST